MRFCIEGFAAPRPAALLLAVGLLLGVSPAAAEGCPEAEARAEGTLPRTSVPGDGTERAPLLRELHREPLPYLAVHDEPRAVPAHVLLDAEGRETGVGAAAGKVRVVNFWATWCAPCRHEMPALDRLQQTLGGSEFEVLAVSLDRDADRVEAFYTENGIQSLACLFDRRQRASSSMRVVSLPTTLLVSPDDREIGRMVGIAVWDSEETVEALRNTVALYRP